MKYVKCLTKVAIAAAVLLAMSGVIALANPQLAELISAQTAAAAVDTVNQQNAIMAAALALLAGVLIFLIRNRKQDT